MPKVMAGLDLAYDESVETLVDVQDPGADADAAVDLIDHLNVGAFAGYEHVAARGSLIVQIGSTFLRKDIEGQVPRFYQRLGLKFHFLKNGFLGLNVDFRGLSRANNLEFNSGQRWQWF